MQGDDTEISRPTERVGLPHGSPPSTNIHETHTQRNTSATHSEPTFAGSMPTHTAHDCTTTPCAKYATAACAGMPAPVSYMHLCGSAAPLSHAAWSQNPIHDHAANSLQHGAHQHAHADALPEGDDADVEATEHAALLLKHAELTF